MRESRWLTATIEDLSALVKRYKIDEPAKEGRGGMFPINSTTEPAIREAQLHIYPHFYTQMHF